MHLLTDAGYRRRSVSIISPCRAIRWRSAAMQGRLRRNFQGFTDDAAPVLLGLGASAISCFPELLVQNEKNAGRYRMLLSQDL